MSQARHIKTIRGQLRQLVLELLPSVLTTELYASLQKEMKEQLEVIRSEIRETLVRIEKSAQDHQAFVVREMLASIKAQPAAETQAPEAAPAANE